MSKEEKRFTPQLQSAESKFESGHATIKSKPEPGKTKTKAKRKRIANKLHPGF